jgi:hypothetical protein
MLPRFFCARMQVAGAFAFLFLTQADLAQQPTPLLPNPKLTPGDVFDVTAQDICVPGYARKVRAVPVMRSPLASSKEFLWRAASDRSRSQCAQRRIDNN